MLFVKITISQKSEVFRFINEDELVNHKVIKNVKFYLILTFYIVFFGIN